MREQQQEETEKEMCKGFNPLKPPNPSLYQFLVSIPQKRVSSCNGINRLYSLRRVRTLDVTGYLPGRSNVDSSVGTRVPQEYILS